MTFRVWLCPDCGARVLIVRNGTFGSETYMVDAEPHEAGYLALDTDPFGDREQPVGVFCSDREVLRRLAADEDARFHRLHLFCEQTAVAS